MKSTKKTWEIAIGVDFDLMPQKWGIKFELPVNLVIELWVVKIDIGFAIRPIK